jgi:hypothetical protein
MGKLPELPAPIVKKVRRAIRKSVKMHKAANALVQKMLKAAGKPKNAEEKSMINKIAYRAAIRAFPGLQKAVVDAIRKA